MIKYPSVLNFQILYFDVEICKVPFAVIHKHDELLRSLVYCYPVCVCCSLVEGCWQSDDRRWSTCLIRPSFLCALVLCYVDDQKPGVLPTLSAWYNCPPPHRTTSPPTPSQCALQIGLLRKARRTRAGIDPSWAGANQPKCSVCSTSE